jgi:predicted transcriptional regulator
MLPETMVQNNANQIVETFIDQHIDSFVKWELVHFFYNNKHTADTATQIANAIRRNVRTVHPALKSLAHTGVVERIDFDDLSIYTLSEDEIIRKKLKIFMEACEDRFAYLQALYHIMQRLR